ncbi:MAG: glycoside hydrolase family 172 protein [Candidatus Omnitrophota bacterium]
MNKNGALGCGILSGLCRIRLAKTKRISSYDVTGRNADSCRFEPGEKKVLAEIDGPGCITHIWMTQCGEPFLYREVALNICWDGEKNPSINVPLGDFFCLGHSLVNSFCSLPFTASTASPYKFGAGCALNCYLQMPFRRHARIEMVNGSKHAYNQYFYVDYETYDGKIDDDIAYLHAQWRRENPTPGWNPEVCVNTIEADVANKGNTAQLNNYVIVEASGIGHYIGCNLSVTNLHGTWWGEGDDMIFVDGERWPPSLHGTGSEDYFNQAWGMQENAFLLNGSSIFEGKSVIGRIPWDGANHNRFAGGYQTSYVFHLTNPVHFKKSLKATIEHGHANHTANDYSSTAYWYQLEPHQPFDLLPVEKRLPLLLKFDNPAERQAAKRKTVITPEMKEMKGNLKNSR